MATFEVYMSDAQKIALLKVSKKTGISVSRLLLKGYNYWLSNNPKDLKVEAETFNALMEEREAKQLERDLGDYIGSFDKLPQKVKAYNRALKDGKITPQEHKAYVKQTIKNYEVTQRSKRKRFGTSTKEDRLKEFLEKRGYAVTESGKIRKA